jgi:predicted nucleic acid-binding protein
MNLNWIVTYTHEILDKLLTKFNLDLIEASNVMTDFSIFTNPIVVSNCISVVKDDPDDDKFIECAMECGAKFIISGDKHLLQLINYEGISIVNVSSFLKSWNK